MLAVIKKAKANNGDLAHKGKTRAHYHHEGIEASIHMSLSPDASGLLQKDEKEDKTK
jgi:hypothetical protein